MSAFRKDFNEAKYMSFLIKYDELPEEYNEIWNIQSYRKSYERKIKTLCIYLRVIMIDSV